MTYPSFEPLLKAAGYLHARVVQAGPNTTGTVLDDGTFGWMSHGANAWVGGTVFNILLRTMHRITISSSSPGVHTYTTATNHGVLVTEFCYVLGPQYPYPVLVGKFNEILAEYGDAYSYSPSILIVTGQQDYPFPDTSTVRETAVSAQRVRRNTSPVEWVDDPSIHVDALRRVATVDVNEFRSGDEIRLLIRTAHTQVASLPAAVGDNLSPEWLGCETAARVAEWRLMQAGDENAKMTQFVNDLRNRADKLRARRQITPKSRVGRLSLVNVK